MVVLVCPAVLVLGYWRQGQWHELMIAFAVSGEKKVGLRIGKSWSGWHGHWQREANGGLVVAVNWKGDEQKLVKMRLAPCCSSLMHTWQHKEKVFIEVLGIRSRLISQRQLEDEDGWSLI